MPKPVLTKQHQQSIQQHRPQKLRDREKKTKEREPALPAERRDKPSARKHYRTPAQFTQKQNRQSQETLTKRIHPQHTRRGKPGRTEEPVSKNITSQTLRVETTTKLPTVSTATRRRERSIGRRLEQPTYAADDTTKRQAASARRSYCSANTVTKARKNAAEATRPTPTRKR